MANDQQPMTTLVYLMQNIGRVYGAEQATIDLASAMQQVDGIAVHILLINETRLQQEHNDLKALIESRDLPYTDLSTDHAFSRSLIKQIRTRFREVDGDILHTSGYKADIHGWLACHKLGALVSTVHGWLCRPDPKERFYGWLNTRFLRRFDNTIVLSRYYQQQLIENGVKPASIFRIPSGVAPCNAARPSAGNAPATVGLLGRLSWEKNHELFLRAIAALRPQTDLRVLIAGDGPERDNIQQLIKELNLGDIVEQHAHMDREDFFAQVDIMVLCSRIENLPLSILEAMARHTPVIATRVGGIPDEIDHERTGLLVEQTIPSLSQAIKTLLGNPDEARRMAEAAHEKLKTDFSPQRWIDDHVQLYTRAAAKGSS